MAELLMECEEEDLEPWQQRIKEVEDDDDDDDDDEPIFVREISASKTANAGNTHGVQLGSSRTENGTPARGTFQPSSNHCKTPSTSNPAILPVTSVYQPMNRTPSSAIVQPLQRPMVSPEPLKRPLTQCIPTQQPPRPSPAILQPACRPVAVPSNTQPVCRHATFPAMAQPALRPVATITAQPVILNQGYLLNSSQVSSSNSQNVMFALRQSTALTQFQGVQTLSTTATQGCKESVLMEKRPALMDIHSISPKKPKNNENAAENTSNAVLSPVKLNPTTPSQNTPAKGTSPVTTEVKNGAHSPRACPKCNRLFNVLESMNRHMRYCGREKPYSIPSKYADNSGSQWTAEDIDKGKLIMLVSDFYYGKHEGDPHLVLQEQKTHTTFKCFSCQKVLKNNVRFMNHMKHHLELEKQSTESWENHTTCHHCYRQFPTPFQLQCHIESSHTLYESTTICKICELSFESEQALLQHMKDNHKPGEMPYVCQVCNYRSSTFLEVDNHFRKLHENTKCLLCPFCLKVIKSGTTYVQHYMKHQKKGVYRCAKCRLQFLTCKEKMDHKMKHHRTFRKPRQLEGLPPGTKVTIRASIGSIVNTVPTPTSPVGTSPTSTTFQASSKIKNTHTKPNPIPAAKTNVKNPKPKPPPAKKKPPVTRAPKRVKMVNTALRNLRSTPGTHKCIECQSEIKDFENHYYTYVHCSKCKFSTNCNKAYTNHWMSFHGRNSSKRSWASKKALKEKRRITLVCLNCDFLTDVSGLDEMAKHLGENHTHSCQVILENVSIFTSTLEGDMSKSGLPSAVGQRAAYRKKIKYEAGLTNKSIGSKNSSAEIKEESHATDEQVKASIFLNKGLITSSGPEEDSKELILGNCSENQDTVESKLLYIDDKEDCGTVQENDCGTEACQQSDQSSVEVSFFDDGGDGKTSPQTLSIRMEDYKDINLTEEEDLSFEQFLRRRDEKGSMSSDISEQSSVHLEPLTPSEVLEHEATEILQKGGVAASSKKGPNDEQSEDTKESSMDTSATVKSEMDIEES
ncbi:zinc finger protein 280D isoform 2-T2 [Discoglossus pictus]